MEEGPLSGNYNYKEEDHQGEGFQRKSNAMFKLTRGGLIKEDEGEESSQKTPTSSQSLSSGSWQIREELFGSQ